MDTILSTIHRFGKRYLLALLLGGYLLAALVPSAGVALRAVRLGTLPFGHGLPLSLPLVMLSWLLLSAGLSVESMTLRRLARHPWLLVAAVAANVLLPLAYAALVSVVGLRWHNAEEVQNVLVGLALIGAMPIAGSSTAWAQNADGDMGMSLGLVLLSTAVSPLLTPWCFHVVGNLTTGDYAEDLHELAHQGSGAFVAWSVVIPSLLGLALRFLLGSTRVHRWLPLVKVLTLIDLLVLNYANGCATLPQIFAQPDWDFLLVTLVVTGLLCAVAFGVGWLLARLFRAPRPQQVSVMFGLGMNNHGAGLVRATLTLADHPLVLLPVLFYNIVQQIAAAVADRWMTRASPPPSFTGSLAATTLPAPRPRAPYQARTALVRGLPARRCPGRAT